MFCADVIDDDDDADNAAVLVGCVGTISLATIS